MHTTSPTPRTSAASSATAPVSLRPPSRSATPRPACDGGRAPDVHAAGPVADAQLRSCRGQKVVPREGPITSKRRRSSACRRSPPAEGPSGTERRLRADGRPWPHTRRRAPPRSPRDHRFRSPQSVLGRVDVSPVPGDRIRQASVRAQTERDVTQITWRCSRCGGAARVTISAHQPCPKPARTTWVECRVRWSMQASPWRLTQTAPEPQHVTAPFPSSRDRDRGRSRRLHGNTTSARASRRRARRRGPVER